VATIVLVAAFVATFFKKTKSMPETPAETVPQNVETPVVPAVVVEVDQTQVVAAAETSAITAKKPAKKTAAKKPAVKKAPAKKKPVVK
jgi:hypothetical protein